MIKNANKSLIEKGVIGLFIGFGFGGRLYGVHSIHRRRGLGFHGIVSLGLDGPCGGLLGCVGDGLGWGCA